MWENVIFSLLLLVAVGLAYALGTIQGERTAQKRLESFREGFETRNTMAVSLGEKDMPVVAAPLKEPRDLTWLDPDFKKEEQTDFMPETS